VLTPDLYNRAINEIILPTVRGLAARGTPYRGVLYAGLMLTADGPGLVEYNARFGDPECQVMMMRLDSDLLDLLHAAATGSLNGMEVRWKDAWALTVILATRGYPGSYGKGSEIRGLDTIDDPQVQVFHAGTRRDGERLLAAGGRVLNVTALGTTVKDAYDRAYRSLDKIDWPEGFCRRDIGWREIHRSGN
jgi:phosphoribosylamine--glycine ligase